MDARRHNAALDDLSPAEAQDLAACKRLLAHGSRTFLAASKLLPGTVRDPACALYAFCRLADDEVDGQTGGGEPAAAGDAEAQRAAALAVTSLRHRLDSLAAPTDPVLSSTTTPQGNTP